MAHAAIFDVTVDTWSEGKSAKPRTVRATCRTCAATFHAAEGQRAGDGVFAAYLGAIHLRCPQCGAEGPVQIRRLKRP
jgi:hypothetical protein